MAAPGPNYDAYESLTVSNASVGFTAGTMGGNRDHAIVTVEVATVRFRLDGNAPTATVGLMLVPGDVLELDAQPQLEKIRFIRRDGSDATLRCAFGK